MLPLMPPRPRVHQLSVPNMSEIDFGKLRAGRLARLQAMLKRHDFPAVLLYSTANIRYATGADVMAVWTAGTFARYCLVPAEGAPILFEYKGSIHVSQKIVRDVRPAYTWQYGGTAARDKAREWTRSIRSTLRELGCEHERLAVDKLDAVGFLALQAEGIAIVDVGPATVDAREGKTREEIELCALNGAIGDAMLAEFEAAIRPGIREYELLAGLSDALLRRRGEGLFTRLVASGANTNPWLTEAQDKAVMPGDLVGVDTDANGVEGYVIDVSRTFLCGDAPSSEQKEAYRVAYERVSGMLELVRPGVSFEEFARKAPRLPPAYAAQRYPTTVHQAGLEAERRGRQAPRCPAAGHSECHSTFAVPTTGRRPLMKRRMDRDVFESLLKVGQGAVLLIAVLAAAAPIALAGSSAAEIKNCADGNW